MEPEKQQNPPQESAQESTPKTADSPVHHATPLRTLSSDMAESMKQNQGKVVKAAIEEEERRTLERENLSPVSKKNLAFIIGGLCLLVIALSAGVYTIRKAKKESVVAVVPVTPVQKSLVRTDASLQLAIAGLRDVQIGEEVQKLTTARNNRFGTISEIIVTDTTAPTAKRVSSTNFLSAIDAHTAKSFVQSIRSEFMLGMYTHDQSHVFMILSGPARDILVAGMKNWEDFLLDDMAPLIGFDTKNDPNDYTHAPFADSLVENRSVRAIMGKDGIPVLFYSFLNEQTIVITADVKTFAEIIRRQTR